jgi:hypothetical protein
MQYREQRIWKRELQSALTDTLFLVLTCWLVSVPFRDAYKVTPPLKVLIRPSIHDHLLAFDVKK